jgi:polyribonucleotide nucleotidyltransferase
MNQLIGDGATVAKAMVGSQELSVSTGELATQAGGSVVVQLGETVVLATATMGKPFAPDSDFMPLLVDYEEKFYAAGKIKGSRFVKREGRPSDEAILTARLIDRAIRPLFPDGMINDIQIVCTVLSYDGKNDPDVLALIGTAGALMVSNIPWSGPLAAVRMGQVNGELIANPTTEQRAVSDLDLVVAGTGTSVVMLEAGGTEIPEDRMLDALEESMKVMGAVTPLLQELASKVGKTKKEPTLSARNEAASARISAIARPILREKLAACASLGDPGVAKTAIGQAERDTRAAVLAQLSDEEKETISEKLIGNIVHEEHAIYFRERVLADSWRGDGRALDQVRPIAIRAGLLPRTHGSGLFKRGQTQVLTSLTLGGPSDQQLIDTMEHETKKRYIHYYNFPAFSVGEIKPNRGPGRREIGHGALAERALMPMLPPAETWPYMMMMVSEVLESHGSSSMASVCGSSLALMDGGVPIKKPVAGIAMGLVSEEKDGKITNFKVLTDIAGIEDEKGDMDFKVAGTRDGITAIQMDIKVGGLNRPIFAAALEQAKAARLHILGEMAKVIAEPRADLSPYAPRIEIMRIPVEKIGDLIGPKGKHINEIIEQTGVEIDIEDDGLVSITSNDPAAMAKAKEWVHNMTRELKPGERFDGRVSRIMDFGAFVELVPGVEGMVHISQFKEERIDSIHDVVKVGDVIPVIVTEIDAMGRINLSHKGALPGGNANPSAGNARRPGGGRPQRSGPFRGPRPPR